MHEGSRKRTLSRQGRPEGGSRGLPGVLNVYTQGSQRSSIKHIVCLVIWGFVLFSWGALKNFLRDSTLHEEHVTR